MQSYFQYRQLGRRLEEQLQRHSHARRRNSPHDILGGKDHQVLRFAANDDDRDDSWNNRTFDQDVEKQIEMDESGNEKDTDTPSPNEKSDDSDSSPNEPQEPQTEGTEAQRTLSGASEASKKSFGTRLGTALTGVDARRRTTNDGGNKNEKVFVVGWQGDNDPLNPQNWGYGIKVLATIQIAFIGGVAGFASSIDSTALEVIAEDFGVSLVSEALGTTGIYLLGFGAGGLFSGPISEAVGRNPVYIGTLGIFMIWIMASALAPNIGAQLVFRFLAGFFASTPLTCAGGSVADMWSPLERVFTFPVFANAAFMGPVLGPVVGGFIVESTSVSWRWVDWVSLIFAGVVTICVVLFQPETYQPVLLQWKAQHLRRITGDERYRAPIEVSGTTWARRLELALIRPFVLTAQEPIIILITLYLTVVYIVLFTFFDGYSYIFIETYGLTPGIGGLCFAGIALGLCISSAFVPLVYKWAKRDLEKLKEQGKDKLPPEFRLWFAMLGGSIAFPVGLFWMAWTAYPSISIWSPLAGSVLVGYGILAIFISSYQYIIDSYEIYAASALASVTVIRYVASGGMVVVAVPFYENLGVHWTLTILGALGALLAPLPYVFYKYGPKIRKRSKYAPTD